MRFLIILTKSKKERVPKKGDESSEKNLKKNRKK